MRRKMNISIIGSRSFNDALLFNKAVNEIIESINEPVTIISGGAKGADSLAATYAKQNNLPLLEYKPDWKKYGRGAGPVRNAQIISDADLIIAFWDGVSKGTLDAINKAKKMNKLVHLVQL